MELRLKKNVHVDDLNLIYEAEMHSGERKNKQVVDESRALLHRQIASWQEQRRKVHEEISELKMIPVALFIITLVIIWAVNKL